MVYYFQSYLLSVRYPYPNRRYNVRKEKTRVPDLNSGRKKQRKYFQNYPVDQPENPVDRAEGPVLPNAPQGYIFSGSVMFYG